MPTEAGLAEAYADACAQMSRAYGETAHQRDRQAARLADVQRAIDVARDPLSGSTAGPYAFGAAVAVPMSCAGKTRGVGLLYFIEGDRLPGEAELQHLTMLGALFGPALHLALLADAARLRPRPAPPAMALATTH